jgi:uncharacterized protein YbjT (DUF2867 family)
VILVTGARGNVGRHVVSGLLAEGADVRALTRDPRSGRWPEGIEVTRGDLSVATSLEAALRAVDAVFLLWQQASAEHPDAAVEAIGRHTHRVVYVSSLTVDDDLEQQAHPMTVIHANIERLIRTSGLGWTFLRAGRFATNSLAWAPEIRAGDVVRLPNAAAGRSPIDPRDVAAVAVRTLVDDGHAHATHILTGPQRLTEREMVHVIGEVIGRALRVDEVPAGTARQELLDAGSSPELADAALAYWAKLIAEPEPVTRTVQEIAGAPARTFREWATDHADDFR